MNTYSTNDLIGMSFSSLPYYEQLIGWMMDCWCEKPATSMQISKMLTDIEGSYNRHRKHQVRRIEIDKDMHVSLYFSNGHVSMHKTAESIVYVGAWYALAQADPLKSDRQKISFHNVVHDSMPRLGIRGEIAFQKLIYLNESYGSSDYVSDNGDMGFDTPNLLNAVAILAFEEDKKQLTAKVEELQGKLDEAEELYMKKGEDAFAKRMVKQAKRFFRGSKRKDAETLAQFFENLGMKDEANELFDWAEEEKKKEIPIPQVNIEKVNDIHGNNSVTAKLM